MRPALQGFFLVFLLLVSVNLFGQESFDLNYAAVEKAYPSFVWNAKRVVHVTQAGLERSRTDRIHLERDGQKNLQLKLFSSSLAQPQHWRYVHPVLERVDQKQIYDRQTRKSVFNPLLQHATAYWQEFWALFPESALYEKKGTEQLQERTCDRYQVSQTQETVKGRKVKGEIWVDPATAVVLKSHLEGDYLDDREGAVRVVVTHELRDLGKVASLAEPPVKPAAKSARRHKK